MCTHSQFEAQAQGFIAMQYNLVVSTNESAVRLWQSQGFEIAGTLTGAFKHARLGFVDAYVMYKELKP
jgi:ribosomal protein S18 acetylase RimI-like enzyme